MYVSDIITTKCLSKDIEAVEDFYGAKGYIDVTPSTRNLNVLRIPNTETGTIDLEFQIDEGQRSYIEKIEIRGNTITKDKVIRRELAVSPGEVFDMVRVKVSKQRLEGLTYFEQVDARPKAGAWRRSLSPRMEFPELGQPVQRNPHRRAAQPDPGALERFLYWQRQLHPGGRGHYLQQRRDPRADRRGTGAGRESPDLYC